MKLATTLVAIVAIAATAPDCNDANFKAAHAAAKASNDQAMKDLVLQAQQHPASTRMTARQTIAWQQFVSGPGAPPEIHTRADLFKPIRDTEAADSAPVEQRRASCQLGASKPSQS
jgi:hypothetical protein